MSGEIKGIHRSVSPSEIQELAFNTQLGTGAVARDGTEKRHVDLKGPSAQEVLTLERGHSAAGTRTELLGHLSMEVGAKTAEAAGNSRSLLEAVAHKLGGSAALVASRGAEVIAGGSAVVGLFEFYAQMVEHTVAAKESGEKLNDAMVRDAVTVSVLLDADRLLPGGFLEARRADLRPAQRALDALRVNPQGTLSARERAGLQALIKQQFKEGLTTALTQSLSSPDELRQRMASDVAFGHQYRADVAFREGVNAAVWLAQTRPKEFAARRQLVASAAPPAASASPAPGGTQAAGSQVAGSQVAGSQGTRPPLSAAYKDGAEWGFGFDLTSRSKLGAALARDASFKDRYQKDSEFRRGVDFIVLVGEKRPEEFRRMQRISEQRGAAAINQ